MALFQKIEDESTADEAIFLGMAGAVITTLLCLPAFFRSASGYLDATNHYDRQFDAFLYPHLPELGLLILAVISLISFKFKHAAWAAIALGLVALLRLIIVHGVQTKPLSMGVFLSMIAVVCLSEGFRGARAKQAFKTGIRTPIPPESGETFDYDKFEAEERIKWSGYGAYTISFFIFAGLFEFIFSGTRTYFIESAGFSVFLLFITFMSIFIVIFIFLARRVDARKDTLSAMLLLWFFSVYFGVVIAAQVLQSNTNPLNIIANLVIFGMLLVGAIGTYKYNKKYQTDKS